MDGEKEIVQSQKPYKLVKVERIQRNDTTPRPN